MKKAAIIVCAIVLTVVINSPAEKVGEEVYPSEEELYEAYLNGEIDYDTYINLKEIIQLGIDSTEYFLIEEIPNVSYFLRESPGEYSREDQEKLDPYLAEPVKAVPLKLNGRVRWQRYQRLEENGDFENNLNINARYGDNWTFQTRARQDYNARRKVLSRSLTYESQRGQINKFVLGNYAARFGLGLNVGYRGIIFDKDEIPAEETSLFPYYGGFNGIYVEGGDRDHGAQGLVHVDQDSTHRFEMAGFDILRRYGRIRTEFMLLGARILKRKSDEELTHYQFGGLVGYLKNDFEIALETTMPKGGSNLFPATLLEAKYLIPRVDMYFSAWRYADDFHNFFGGGRSGPIYRSYEIEEVDLSLRDRRIDQRGILFKTRSRLTDGTGFDLAFTTYGAGQFNNGTEISVGFDRKLDSRKTLRLYYEYERRKTGTEVKTDYRIRGEYRLITDDVYLRSYVGYRRDYSKSDYLSQYIRCRYRTEQFGTIEAWLNLSRYNLETGMVDYFYGYLKEIIEVTNFLEFAAKFMYRYSRNYSDREQLTFMMETSLEW